MYNINNIVKDFKIVEILGQGQFGTVYKVQSLINYKFYALKLILYSKINNITYIKELINNEITIMKNISHENIINCYDNFTINSNIHLILDYCNNGDLEDYLNKNDAISEKTAIEILYQIMKGFKEWNNHKIIHRDLKLANIFINDDKIIIGDFGFSKYNCNIANSTLGTIATMAPELYNECYNSKIDLWSIGACFYKLLFGQYPFLNFYKNFNVKKIIENSGINLYIPNNNISDLSINILKNLLEPNSAKRIEWKDFFNHPIFKSMNQYQNKYSDNSYKDSFILLSFNQDLYQDNVYNNDVDLNIELGNFSLNNNNNYNKEYTQINNYLYFRYLHELKLVDYIFLTSQNLYNLTMNLKIKELLICIMYKGILILKLYKDSIEKEINIFDIKNFNTKYIKLNCTYSQLKDAYIMIKSYFIKYIENYSLYSTLQYLENYKFTDFYKDDFKNFNNLLRFRLIEIIKEKNYIQSPILASTLIKCHYIIENNTYFLYNENFDWHIADNFDIEILNNLLKN